VVVLELGTLCHLGPQTKKNRCWNLVAHLKPDLLKTDADVACYVGVTWVPELDMLHHLGSSNFH
jgi:hypothetical protein